MGIFTKIAEGLKKTRDNFLGGLQRIFNSFTKIDEELFEELEEQMIMSDIGVETSEEICERVRKKVKERGITDPKDIMELIYEVISEIMGDDVGLDMSTTPSVIMVIGVNGAGKTTTIGKMCQQFRQDGKKVLVAAADTFRAAAIDQLEVWTQRAGVDIVKHAEGSDPGAVVYDSLEAAKARKCDVVVIDTAGRLHNKKNLMEELKKINRIIDNKAEGCAREVLLVLDATTGQNAVSQAKLFSETAPITGIVLTKLDGTAKGGIVISIKNELGIPVKLIGVGEKIDDLQPFDSRMFVDALFDIDEAQRKAAERDDEEDEIVEEVEEAVEAADEETESEEVADDKKKKGFFGLFASNKDDEDEEPVNEEEEAEEEAAEEETAEEVAEEEPDSKPEKKKKGFFGLFASDDENYDAAEEPVENEEVAEEEAVEEATEEAAEEEPDSKPEKKKKGFFGLFASDDENDDAAEEPVNEEEVAEEETVEEATEEVAEEEPENKPEKKKGFFSRLFGKKGNDEDE